MIQAIAVQFDIVWEDKAANFEKVRTLLSSAGVKPGALVVLPEMFATGFSMNVTDLSEPHDGPTERFAAELSKQHAAYVVAGVVNRSESGKGANESVVFDRGELLGRYRKMQPFSLGEEDKYYDAGDAPLTLELGGAALSPFICYDLRFPEHFRTAATMGAQIITVIASWPAKRIGHWSTLLRARAIENQAFVVGVNRTGRDPFHEYCGASAIIDPSGAVLAEANDAECLISAELDLDMLRDYRAKLPFLADMKQRV